MVVTAKEGAVTVAATVLAIVVAVELVAAPKMEEVEGACEGVDSDPRDVDVATVVVTAWVPKMETEELEAAGIDVVDGENDFVAATVVVVVPKDVEATVVAGGLCTLVIVVMPSEKLVGAAVFASNPAKIEDELDVAAAAVVVASFVVEVVVVVVVVAKENCGCDPILPKMLTPLALAEDEASPAKKELLEVFELPVAVVVVVRFSGLEASAPNAGVVLGSLDALTLAGTGVASFEPGIENEIGAAVPVCFTSPPKPENMDPEVLNGRLPDIKDEVDS